MGLLPTIDEINAEFELGSLSSIELVHSCLDRILDPAGEGSRVFTKINSARSRKLATISYQQRTAGVQNSPLMGLPVSVKDLFDVEGEKTLAGSTLLSDVPSASKNALVVHRLLQAGAILIGRTNMTEFAYSGVGLNPHYGTPAGPFDRTIRRIPGGSSSGAGVSVADRMAVASIGTDTGGSVRIPAALCGITGFKPTARRLPTDGVFPLSQSFDSVGPLAPSVSCCITMDQIMAGLPVEQLYPFPLRNLRFAVPKGLPTDHLDEQVSSSFEAALTKLSKAGAHIEETRVQAIEHSDRISAGATLLAAEAYAVHRRLLEGDQAAYDPRVSTRILPAADTSAADYIDLIAWRQNFIQRVEHELYTYDAVLMPTTPVIAPPIQDLEESDEVYFSTNALMLRNTCIVNQMDGCALSIPCHNPGEAPVGLMLVGLPMNDKQILQIGLSIEHVLNQ